MSLMCEPGSACYIRALISKKKMINTQHRQKGWAEASATGRSYGQDDFLLSWAGLVWSRSTLAFASSPSQVLARERTTLVVLAHPVMTMPMPWHSETWLVYGIA